MCLPLPNLDEVTLSKGEHVGYEWQTVHNGNRYRCGYIKVLSGHPWFGRGYNDGLAVDVHGGITFAEHGAACPTHGPEAEWWIGFDCGHAGDAQDPALPNTRYPDVPFEGSPFRRYMGFSTETIRTTAYVEAECRSLCEQAAAAYATV